MPEGKGKNGFTMIEVLILIAIFVILGAIFAPQLIRIYWKKAGNCENALEIHKKIATDIHDFIKILELPEDNEKRRKLEEFKTSESGKVFFDEFCQFF